MSDPNADGRSQNEFWSVDSAPKRFAGKVPQHRAPLLLVVFMVVSTLLLFGINATPEINRIFPYNDLILGKADGAHAIPLRIFILSFFMSFGLFCDPAWSKKFGIIADMSLTYLAICFALDCFTLVLDATTDLIFSLHIVEISSGLIGFAIYSFKLLERGEMPARVEMEIDTSSTPGISLRLIGLGSVAALISAYVASLDLELVAQARAWTLLGGIGPGVFLFLPVFFLLLYALARFEQAIAKQSEFCPALTIIVPAHNEEYIIERTIEAMDVAAGNYGGDVLIYIMNNNSEDATEEIARRKLENCKHAKGKVINEYKAGKSNALNSGLDAVETEYFVRVDADTLIDPMSIKIAMRRFADPTVGVVGGLPVPPGGALFDRARFLEVVVKHGFYSVGMGAINSVVGIPGMLAIYQTKLPRDLGGFVEGMNGEDTDISLRIGEMGYKLIVDPKVRYISEVPASYHHMREQRMRWFRSIYHISARCRELIYSPRATVRGKIILPYMLINSGRRAMMVPLILFGMVEYLTAFDSFNTLTWQAVVAVGVGAPTLIAIFSSLINGSVKGILYVPEYLIFRLMRAYFTLESMLSISIKGYGEHIYSKAAYARKRPASIRVA